jgi:hypothetical protein
MLTLDIRHNFDAVAKRLEQLPKEVAQKATPRAINRTADQGKVAMSREIRAEFNIKRDKVERSLRVIRADFRGGIYNVTAAIESPRGRGKSLNLIEFVVGRRNGRVLSVKIKKQGGRTQLPGAFIANKGRTVFRRVPGSVMPSRSASKGMKHREAIKALQTIDVAQMFNTRRVNERVVRVVRERFPINFEREAAYYLDRFNKAKP